MGIIKPCYLINGFVNKENVMRPEEEKLYKYLEDKKKKEDNRQYISFPDELIAAADRRLNKIKFAWKVFKLTIP